MAFTLITFAVFISDQIIKRIVAGAMAPNQSIPLLNNILHLTYVQNRGAAFGIFWGKTWFLLFVGAVVIAAIIYFHERIKFNDMLQAPLALLLGGSLGNLSDRFIFHYVVDYIDFRVWPVFNLADIFINIGVFLIIITLFIERKEA